MRAPGDSFAVQAGELDRFAKELQEHAEDIAKVQKDLLTLRPEGDRPYGEFGGSEAYLGFHDAWCAEMDIFTQALTELRDRMAATAVEYRAKEEVTEQGFTAIDRQPAPVAQLIASNSVIVRRLGG
ncbi:hypothetical protein D5S17_16010 [Pseudonocardiaceae bacterium YIM PH 21723]|nr:hypothetical protein D5S17_16010 [Pseudonocardiaceae bacterium YIM PH 21723]